MKKREREELTFKPRTNETKNRDVLQQIMRDEKQSEVGQRHHFTRASRDNSGSPGQMNMRDELNRGGGGLLGHAYSQSDLRNRNPNEE